MYFYSPDLSKQVIHPPFSDHLLTCRPAPGEIIHLTDLDGSLGKFEIINVEKKNKAIFVRQISLSHTPPNLKRKNILIQAQIDKLYLEKLFEILPLANIDELILYPSDYSPKQNIPFERLDKILIRSCEQSQTLYKPRVSYQSRLEIESTLKQLHPIILEGKKPTALDTNSSLSQPIMIGPEGGWSERETILFESLNLPFANLGQTVYPAWIAGLVWFGRN